MKGWTVVQIENILFLSIYHISPSTRSILNNNNNCLDLVIHNTAKGSYLILVDLDITDLSTIPHDLLYLLRLAHINDCMYLELNSNIAPVDDVLLTVYNKSLEEEVHDKFSEKK